MEHHQHGQGLGSRVDVEEDDGAIELRLDSIVPLLQEPYLRARVKLVKMGVKHFDEEHTGTKALPVIGLQNIKVEALDIDSQQIDWSRWGRCSASTVAKGWADTSTSPAGVYEVDSPRYRRRSADRVFKADSAKTCSVTGPGVLAIANSRLMSLERIRLNGAMEPGWHLC